MRTIPVLSFLPLRAVLPAQGSSSSRLCQSYTYSLLCIRIPAPKSAPTQSGISTLPFGS